MVPASSALKLTDYVKHSGVSVLSFCFCVGDGGAGLLPMRRMSNMATVKDPSTHDGWKLTSCRDKR
jgi:hypothetical protein